MNDKPAKQQKSRFAHIEEDLLVAWDREKTFEKSLQNRQDQPVFIFNDGPPFANGLPHFGHSLVTGVKDSILRYKTMRGYYVPRRNGWDCHGLPVEYDIEKQFGISGKKQILELGIDKFNAACRASIFRYKEQWEDFLKRFGRWSDYQHYYATVDTNYTESVWWILGEINKKGLLYRGFKSLPYCPRCETPLSNFELNEGYKDNVPDPSVFALFPLTPESTKELQQRLGLDARQGSDEQQTEGYKAVHRGSSAVADDAVRQKGELATGFAGGQGRPSVSLLAWTTTPWTLPANAALVVDPAANYAYVQLKSDGSTLILAQDRLEVLDLRQTDYRLLKTVKGAELVGQAYQPLYPLPPDKFSDDQVKAAHRVYADDSVSLQEGTGILHVAPRYGETDLALGQQQNLPLIESVDSSGHMVYPYNLAGQFFKAADASIIAELTRAGRLFAAEIAEHTYPFCWRCDTPLMYFATSTWFVAVTKIKDDLLKTAEQINWVPANIKDGRFGKWLEGARDWAISRNRYWGAPLPIWQNVDDENDYIVISSIEELKQLAGEKEVIQALPASGAQAAAGQPAGAAPGALDLHRPFIDEISFQKDGKTYRRVEDVLDCWFESGSMPAAQWHYPFENKESVDKILAADFVTEGLDQTRLWFYVQHVISTILFGQPAFKNVIATGIITAADGQKLSKRLRNYPPTEDVFNQEGADAWRLYLLSSTQAAETAGYMRFNRQAVTDLQRNALDRLYNSWQFFQTYSQLDKWSPSAAPTGQELGPPASDNLLDRWIIVRLEQVIAQTTASADNFKIAHAIEPVLELIDDLSNWYIRRSRRRFWKSGSDSDKTSAYATLHYSLIHICQLLAPWAPFLADHIWRQLKTENMAESVHLSDWPSVKEPDNTSTKLLEEMTKVRGLITEGLAQRAEAKIKVRQPLAQVTAPDVLNPYAEVIKEELNVKSVIWLKNLEASLAFRPELNTDITPELKSEGIARDLIRSIQSARKKAGLNVADRINLSVNSSSPDITEAFNSFKQHIYNETLATGELDQGSQESYSEDAKLDGQTVKISLTKA